MGRLVCLRPIRVVRMGRQPGGIGKVTLEKILLTLGESVVYFKCPVLRGLFVAVKMRRLMSGGAAHTDGTVGS